MLRTFIFLFVFCCFVFRRFTYNIVTGEKPRKNTVQIILHFCVLSACLYLSLFPLKLPGIDPAGIAGCLLPPLILFPLWVGRSAKSEKAREAAGNRMRISTAVMFLAGIALPIAEILKYKI